VEIEGKVLKFNASVDGRKTKEKDIRPAESEIEIIIMNSWMRTAE